jgi:hypothetical protein
MLTARSRVPFPLLLHIARSRSSKEGESFLGGLDHTAVLDGWHLNPTGESDMTLKSRVTMLSHEMLESRYTAIRGLTTRGFRMVDGLFLYGPIAVFPRTVLSWRVELAASVEEVRIPGAHDGGDHAGLVGVVCAT